MILKKKTLFQTIYLYIKYVRIIFKKIYNVIRVFLIVISCHNNLYMNVYNITRITYNIQL